MNGELRKLALKRLIGKRKVSELEKWRRHSLATGVIAKTIADALVSRSVNLDAALCEAGALLHDIGRERTGGMLHGWRGYQILRKERHFLRCARFCITHWLKGRSEEEILKQGDISENLLKKILKEGDFSVLLLEDIVVCVADSMARDDVLVDIKSRYDDARRRYGDSLWLDENLRRTLRFKEELDSLLGRDLYTLFDKFNESISFPPTE